MSRTLSMNCGSGDSSKLSARWGLSPPDPTHRGLVEARRLGHRPRRPMRGVRRSLLQGLDDHPLHVLVADLAGRTRTGLVVQTVEPAGHEPATLLPHRRLVDPERSRDLLVGRAHCARQHGPTAQRQRLRTVRSARPPLERLALITSEHQRCRRSPSSCHRCPPSSSTTTGTQTMHRKFPRTNDSGR
jgi:hypothetical protein